MVLYYIKSSSLRTEKVNVLQELTKKKNFSSFYNLTKIIDFHFPHDLEKVFDFKIGEDPKTLTQILNDCSKIMKHSVKTGIRINFPI